MNELIFRGKDRYRPSWSQLVPLVIVLVLEVAFAAYRLGPVGLCWLFGGTLVLVGVGFTIALRNWSRVGPEGITLCWGFGTGRTYPWQEIRWIDVRETKVQGGTTLAVRMTLTNGRRRSLPGIQHSAVYPDPDFHVDFQRVVDWWELSTDQAARRRPTKQFRDRITPTAAGVVLGLLICVVVVVVVVLRS
ncbi:PH domain-containing protein [Kitasatospora sp. NPDC086801]|uniref:PH domain-containing protein n=1 Tax=Kitasatospora sp. NPDC086801 TaxID=3364066 RepID=UPI0037FD1A07